MLDTLNDADFERFRKTIYDESGITFSATNRPILDSRIKEILREKKIESIDEYYNLIHTDHEEMKKMLDAVTTNLTRFFRNQPHFDALENYVIPHVLEEKKKTGDRTVLRPPGSGGRNLGRTLYDCYAFKKNSSCWL